MHEKGNSSRKFVNINHVLIEEKINFVRLQKEKFLEEHELKMDLLRKKIALTEKKLNDA